jgi:hypothetical protein
MKRQELSKRLVAFPLMGLLFMLHTCEDETYQPNHHPEILSIGQLGYGIPILWNDTLVCLARDEDNDELAYEWTAYAGSLTGSGDTVIWHAPGEVAIYPIECRVIDGKGGYDEAKTMIQVFDYDTLYLETEDLNTGIGMPNDTTVVIRNWEEYVALLQSEIFSCNYASGGGPPPDAIDFDSVIVIGVSDGYIDRDERCGEPVNVIHYVYSIRDTIFVQAIPPYSFHVFNPTWYPYFESRDRPQWITIPQTDLPIEFLGPFYDY